IGDRLIGEDEHGESVHAGLYGRHLLRSQRSGDVHTRGLAGEDGVDLTDRERHAVVLAWSGTFPSIPTGIDRDNRFAIGAAMRPDGWIDAAPGFVLHREGVEERWSKHLCLRGKRYVRYRSLVAHGAGRLATVTRSRIRRSIRHLAADPVQQSRACEASSPHWRPRSAV